VSENTPTISIIVPVHNGGDKFRHCLSSLRATDPGPDEIIVVADGDTDGSWRLAQDSGAQVLRINSRGGHALARNLGAHSAKGEIFFFVDADVTVPPDAVGQISAIFQQDSCLSAVFGSYDDQRFETDFLSQYRNLFHHYVHQTSKEVAATFWGACGVIRRDVLFKMGGFNAGYRDPAIEDIELGYRLKKAGYRIRLLKALMVNDESK
jgi:GT2 family glycosyltransferase